MRITIKKKGETFIIPAMSLLTPDGEKLIPNPNGLKPITFERLDDVITAVHRAGFDAEYDGQLFQSEHLRDRVKPTPQNTLRKQRDYMLQDAMNDAFPLLLKRLSDKEALVLVPTIRALGHYGDAAAIEPLVTLLAHESPDVRSALNEAFTHLPILPTLQQLGNAYGRSLVNERNNEAGFRLRLTVMKSWETMARRHAPESFSVVMTHVLHALNEDQWLIRSAAASMLATLRERQKQEAAASQ